MKITSLISQRKSIKLHDFKAIEMRFEIVEEGRFKMKKTSLIKKRTRKNVENINLLPSRGRFLCRTFGYAKNGHQDPKMGSSSFRP